jgi:hypothetical protein
MRYIIRAFSDKSPVGCQNRNKQHDKLVMNVIGMQTRIDDCGVVEATGDTSYAKLRPLSVTK